MNLKPIHQQKQTAVDQLAAKLAAAPSFLIYEYAGFSARELTQLRADLTQANCEMRVYQNNILNRALIASKLYHDAELVGPNALVLGTDDLEPLKNIAKLAKEKSFIKLKAAYVDGNLMVGASLANFATLATRKDLYVMICQCLHSPLRSLMQVIKATAAAQSSAE